MVRVHREEIMPLRPFTQVVTTARRYPVPGLVLLGLVGGLLAQYLFMAPDIARWIFLTTLVVGGAPVVVGTLRGMLHGRFAADIVASLAILGAGITNEYLAGCVIVLMQTGGEALEDFARRRASASLETLLARAPRVAHRRVGDGIEDVPVAVVAVGDLLVVRPGELIPVDATITRGTAAVDESALTGEPLAETRGPGAAVMSGSICLDGALELQAQRPSGESQYEQIVRLVQAAQADKAPLGRLADRYAIIFTPVTLAMCVLAYVLTRQPQAVEAVLVVATPCPLILATPVAIISGINRAAREGIIVKGGAAIEQIGQATAIVFDKTGTLTAGRPVVERVVPLDGEGEETVLRLAAGLEQLSGHQMARALVAAGQERVGTLPVPEAVTEAAGRGVTGQVEGHTVDVGSLAFARQQNLTPVDAVERVRSETGTDGHATAVVGIDGHAAGLIVYADPLRPSVPALLARLRTLGVRETAMLTGDDAATAQAIAGQAGITTVRADLLPAHKVDAVREMLARHKTVVMVGDGINDAPALATATVGVALGAHGAAISAEAADVVITVDDVGRVGEAMAISQRTLRIAKQSIGIGLGVSGVMMAVAALGYIPPTVGAVLQEALDVAVILNALRAR
jgi:heavy metal translocating P-type ATPase